MENEQQPTQPTKPQWEPLPHEHLPRPTKPQWEPLPHEHLPRPTYFPAGLAMGTTFIAWGLITSVVVFFVGVGLFTASLAGWITELRHARKHE